MLGIELTCPNCDHIMLFHAPAQGAEDQPKAKTVAPNPLLIPGNVPVQQPSLTTLPKKPKKHGFKVFVVLLLALLAYGYFQKSTDTQNAVDTEAPLTPENAELADADPSQTSDESITPEPPTSAVLANDVIPDIENLTNKNGQLQISHFENIIQPFTQKHCISCHGPDKDKGDFRIDELMNTGLIRTEADAEHWQEVLDQINTGEMPPSDEEQPTRQEMTAMIDALYQTTANARDVLASKGNGVMRRLNSREYAFIIKDVLGLSVPEDAIPLDRGIDGFDTLGADLSTTPAELQAYIDVSHSLMQKLTYDYSTGGEIPKEAESIFKGLPRNPTHKHIQDLFQRFVVKVYSHQPVPVTMIQDMTTLFKYNRKKGANFWEAISTSLTCALASPNLIFIVERDVELDQLDIANRLSLLLWSSVPDKTLIKLARAGELTKPEVYAAQFERMIQDDKAQRFFDSFTNQWLELDRLDVVNIDEELFPESKKNEEALKRDMATETQRFLRYLITENRPARELVSADFTILNSQLAEHYGISRSEVNDQGFSKVELVGQDRIRGGLLGQGSIQMLTSNGSRTSPVERGVFILRKLLDNAPPPAPAGIPEIEVVTAKSRTTRETLKEHVSNAQCATCHSKIDPLGFGMESFGPLGRWRTHEGKRPVDASGQMTNGKKFNDYHGLIAGLAENEERIAKSFAKAIMSYAIGRKVRYTDSGEIDHIIQSTKENDFRLKDLIFQVTQSKTFQTKR